MNIVRFEGTTGGLLWGVPVDDDIREARIIEGDLFGDWAVSDRIASVSRLRAPLDPPNIFAVGFNYRRHADETGSEYPDHPELFMKATTSVAGHGEPLLLPGAGPGEVDYEGELAVIIGAGGKDIEPAAVDAHVFGYCCANDVTARDWQWKKQKGQWVRAKSFDTFCPLGPWIVTKNDIADPQGLSITTRLNDETVQHASTADMLFSVSELVSFLSRSMTLLPGTVILTGTPEGVGFARTPPRYLAPGDRIAVTISSVGTLANVVSSPVSPGTGR